MANKSLVDFQRDWESIVEKAQKNYSSLTRDERVWFNIQSLIQAVDDGGLISHYYNSGADFNEETIEDLSSLGFPRIGHSLLCLNALFPNGKPSLDINERNEALDAWPDGAHDSLIDQHEQLFFQVESELEQALILHIERMYSKG